MTKSARTQFITSKFFKSLILQQWPARFPRFPDPWTIATISIALLVSLPVLVVATSLFSDASEVWAHLRETVLSRYILNSLLLMIGVGVGVLGIGVSTAWLVTMCRFPGYRQFEGALLLPMAAPAYVLAYTYTDFLDFSGPVQTLLRSFFGWKYGDYWFPDIRSLWGAIALMALTLYPYVYLLARVSFLEQSVCTLEASRVLGCNPWRSFFTVALPLARPSIVAGLALALMETLNDFGTVQYFGVDTFTTGIYRTWFGMGERIAATQLAAFLLVFIFGLIWLERQSRQRIAFYQTSTLRHNLPRYSLTGLRGIGAMLACLLPIALGFIVPGGTLLHMAIDNRSETFDTQFWEFVRHSWTVAILAASIGVAIAIIIAYGVRLRPHPVMRLASRVAVMGYAIPGAVIAVGIMFPLGRFDNAVDGFMRSTFGISTGLLLSGTLVALVFAYLVRFLAVAYGAIESSLLKIEPSLDEAARSLGCSPTRTLLNVHVPMMQGAVLTSAMLFFVDVMKELPATLVVRPFNFDTLAVRVYNLASDERLAEASGPALALVLVGMIPVTLLSWRIAKSRG